MSERLSEAALTACALGERDDEYVDLLIAEVRERRAAEEALHSWDGLMALLDEHWPESIFPTLPDDEERDPGPRIVSLIRWVDQQRAAEARVRAVLADADKRNDAHLYPDEIERALGGDR